MAKKAQNKEQTPAEVLADMRKGGVEHVMPGTERKVRLRSIDAPELLRTGKMPDILTPLVVRSVYEDLKDRELRDFTSQQRGDTKQALEMLEAVDFVVKSSIADSTKVEDLTLAEKRWIFRLAMGPAEMLVTFRYQPTDDVETVAEGEDVPEATE